MKLLILFAHGWLDGHLFVLCNVRNNVSLLLWHASASTVELSTYERLYKVFELSAYLKACLLEECFCFIFSSLSLYWFILTKCVINLITLLNVFEPFMGKYVLYKVLRIVCLKICLCVIALRKLDNFQLNCFCGIWKKFNIMCFWSL